MYVQYIAIQSTNAVDFMLYKIQLLLLLLCRVVREVLDDFAGVITEIGESAGS